MEIFQGFKNKAIQEQIEAQKVFQREAYKSSLALTASELLNYRQANARTHGDVIAALEAPTKRKLIVMPRGTFKSSIACMSYSIWSLLRNPDLRILIDSELYSNSKNYLREIRGHLESHRLVELFGTFKSDTWNEGELTIRQRKKVHKEASLTASGIGAQKTGQHYDLIICDDLNSSTNSQTKEGRQKVIDHWRYNTSLLEPDGTMVLVGTRYAEDDAIGFVLANEIGVVNPGLI